jgi:hypothetical protein
MYASVRLYRVTDAAEIARRVEDEFLSEVRGVSGFSAYYVIDGGNGSLQTVTITDDASGAEDSASRAANWIASNPDVAALVEGSPTVINGEVLAQA